MTVSYRDGGYQCQLSWDCSTCGCRYESEEEALWCCEPIQHEDYKCSYCDQHYYDEYEADSCCVGWQCDNCGDLFSDDESGKEEALACCDSSPEPARELTVHDIADQYRQAVSL